MLLGPCLRVGLSGGVVAMVSYEVQGVDDV